MRYDHTQTAPLFLLLVAIGATMLIASWSIPERTVQILLVCSSAVMLLLAGSFRQLTTRDESDSLLIAFGPLPLFRRRVPYDAISSAERTRSTLIDGWGIHISPSGGWVWNLWGYDCVDVHYAKGGKLRIGTDDPDGLEAFLNEQVRLRSQ